jgi:hypothetical protein
VVHACNPSYSGVRDQVDHGSNSLRDPVLKNPITKMGWWSGSRCGPWVQTPVPHKKKKEQRYSEIAIKILLASFMVTWVSYICALVLGSVNVVFINLPLELHSMITKQTNEGSQPKKLLSYIINYHLPEFDQIAQGQVSPQRLFYPSLCFLQELLVTSCTLHSGGTSSLMFRRFKVWFQDILGCSEKAFQWFYGSFSGHIKLSSSLFQCP